MDKSGLKVAVIAKMLALSLLWAGIGNAGHHEEEAVGPTIAELAVNSSGLSTLVTALKAAGLVETLSEEGPFTVLAPTDQAFDALPKGALEGLIADKEKLKKVLLSHVISGRTLAETVVTLDSVKALSGEMLTISTEDGVEIAGARVIKTDLLAKNGVVHLIDAVIIP